MRESSSISVVGEPRADDIDQNEHQDGPGWGGYTVDDIALRHGAGVEMETNVPDEAYAAVREQYGMREPTSYRDGWLP